MLCKYNERDCEYYINDGGRCFSTTGCPFDQEPPDEEEDYSDDMDQATLSMMIFGGLGGLI